MQREKVRYPIQQNDKILPYMQHIAQNQAQKQVEHCSVTEQLPADVGRSAVQRDQNKYYQVWYACLEHLS